MKKISEEINDISESSIMLNILEYFDDEVSTIEEGTIEDQTIEEGTKARLPKLNPKEQKKKEAKADVMSKINKDQQFIDAKTKLMRILKKLVFKYAPESGYKPKMINIDKITLKN